MIKWDKIKEGVLPMKHEYDSDKLISSNKKLLSWEELLEKGALLKEAIHRLSLMPGMPYLVTKSCTAVPFRREM